MSKTPPSHDRDDQRPTADPLAGLVRFPIVRLEAGQRLHRIVRLFLWEQETEIEHRIITLAHPGGRLELLAFVFRHPPGTRPTTIHAARAADVPPESLDSVLLAMIESADVHPEDVEMIDLSHLADAAAQVRWLQAQDLLDALAHP